MLSWVKSFDVPKHIFEQPEHLNHPPNAWDAITCDRTVKADAKHHVWKIPKTLARWHAIIECTEWNQSISRHQAFRLETCRHLCWYARKQLKISATVISQIVGYISKSSGPRISNKLKYAQGIPGHTWHTSKAILEITPKVKGDGSCVPHIC